MDEQQRKSGKQHADTNAVKDVWKTFKLTHSFCFSDWLLQLKLISKVLFNINYAHSQLLSLKHLFFIKPWLTQLGHQLRRNQHLFQKQHNLLLMVVLFTTEFWGNMDPQRCYTKYVCRLYFEELCWKNIVFDGYESFSTNYLVFTAGVYSFR